MLGGWMEDKISSKPGRLTPRQREFIRDHQSGWTITNSRTLRFHNVCRSVCCSFFLAWQPFTMKGLLPDSLRDWMILLPQRSTAGYKFSTVPRRQSLTPRTSVLESSLPLWARSSAFGNWEEADPLGIPRGVICCHAGAARWCELFSLGD